MVFILGWSMTIKNFVMVRVLTYEIDGGYTYIRLVKVGRKFRLLLDRRWGKNK